jgi:hypothetical protein
MQRMRTANEHWRKTQTICPIQKWTAIRKECQNQENNKLVVDGTIFTINNTPIRIVDEFNTWEE